MPFNSPQFLFFLLAVAGLNFFIGSKLRLLLQVLASCIFIGCFNLASLLTVILFSLFNFTVGVNLSKKRSSVLFYTAVLVNGLGILVNNYILSANGAWFFSLGSTEFRVSELLLAVGVSFYGLQHMAYLIDVRAKKIPAETNSLNFLWTSVFFPKFISGPISLYEQLKPQLPLLRPSAPLMWQGFNRLLLGLFKKMVIADRLAPSVSSVFDYQDALPGITVLMAAVFFTIQLYFDFSGYCDMALGAAKLMGIELPENFDAPLRSTSVTVFWRRWHQSLIHFLTHYVFYPVSFRYRRFKKHAAAIAIAVTFLISAVWHGIGLTFMAWAICHVLFLLAELYLGSGRKRPAKKNPLLKTGAALWVLLLVAFSNLFFRSTGTANALHLLNNLFAAGSFLPDSWVVQFIAPLAVGGHQLEHFNLVITVFFASIFLLFERRIIMRFNAMTFNGVMTFITLVLIFLFGVFNSGHRFIYMQF